VFGEKFYVSSDRIHLANDMVKSPGWQRQVVAFVDIGYMECLPSFHPQTEGKTNFNAYLLLWVTNFAFGANCVYLCLVLCKMCKWKNVDD
jgi:hypothetical protein